jgi:hypothetical protein
VSVFLCYLVWPWLLNEVKAGSEQGGKRDKCDGSHASSIYLPCLKAPTGLTAPC